MVAHVCILVEAVKKHFVARGVANGVFVLKVYVLMTAAVTFSSVDATQDNTMFR